MNIKNFQKIILVFIVASLILQGIILMKVTTNSHLIAQNTQNTTSTVLNLTNLIRNMDKNIQDMKVESQESDSIIEGLDYKVSNISLEDKSYNIRFDIMPREVSEDTVVTVSYYDKMIELEKTNNHYKGEMTVKIPMVKEDEVFKAFEVSVINDGNAVLEEFNLQVPRTIENLVPTVHSDIWEISFDFDNSTVNPRYSFLFTNNDKAKFVSASLNVDIDGKIVYKEDYSKYLNADNYKSTDTEQNFDVKRTADGMNIDIYTDFNIKTEKDKLTTIYLEATTDSGYHYKYTLDKDVFNDEENSPSFDRTCTVKDKSGNVILEYSPEGYPAAERQISK